jgi:thioredoxin reductase (NADPH)
VTEPLDCLVIGGGPAGLTAAIYLARFRLAARVVDAGRGRASLIPCTRNHAGFPDGISGPDLLARMRDQATRAGAEWVSGQVERLSRAEGGFIAHTPTGEILARTLLLATGVTNHRPDMSDAVHAAAVAAGRLRYCPVCDGFEVTDQNVGVIGTGARGVKEAVFLRAYSSRVTLIAPDGNHDLSDQERRTLSDAGVALVNGPVSAFGPLADGLGFRTPQGALVFETVYPAMGSQVHSGLARELGADLTSEGCVRVDAHQRTSVPGLYAAGDVVIGLDQISHAMGEAGVSATAIRNDLAQRSPLRR